jgi:hypothetical protein
MLAIRGSGLLCGASSERAESPSARTRLKYRAMDVTQASLAAAARVARSARCAMALGIPQKMRSWTGRRRYQ